MKSFVKGIVTIGHIRCHDSKCNSNELLVRIKDLLPERRDVIHVCHIPVRSVQFYDQMYSQGVYYQKKLRKLGIFRKFTFYS